MRISNLTAEAMVRLAEFIEAERGPILDEWVLFAEACAPDALNMTKAALRDHASEMLDDIVVDLRSYESEGQRKTKSMGADTNAAGPPETAAEVHGAGRAVSGFTVEELTSEYRALRASVLRLWTSAQAGLTSVDIDDLMRFNEAMDQGLAESVAYFAKQNRARDLTLRVSEQRYSLLLREMAEGVLLYNAEQHLDLWNPAAEAILGLTGDQLSGVAAYDPLWKAVDADDQLVSLTKTFAAPVLRTGKRVSGVIGVHRADESRVWLQVSAAPLVDVGETAPYAVEVTLTDVTAARDASRLLAESEARYRLLATNSVDLISRVSPSGLFEYISPSFTTVLGWREDQLIGQPAAAFVHVEDADAVRTRFATLEGNMAQRPLLVRASHANGQVVWMESIATPILDDSGAVVGAQVAERNVSERRALEAQLSQAHKMEALGRMANGVAHDVNNLLMVVRASADLMRADIADAAERRANLDAIDVSVDRAAMLTTQLLAFSRGRHTDPTAVTVGGLLQTTHVLLKRVVGPGIAVALEVSLDAQEAWITADPRQVEQVLLDLVLNAADALLSGGVVSVDARVDRVEQPLVHRHGVVAPGSYVVLSVADHGVGMTDTVLTRLFDPFYTTKPQGRGLGLGMSVVFGIVEQVHGAVVVESEVGRGSTVHVYWPQLARERPPEVKTRITITPVIGMRPVLASASASPGRSEARILLVDDDPAVRRVVSRLLERDGYVAVTAGTGAEGVAVALQEGTALGAILSDVRMPGMTGVEMVAHLIERGIDLPVLFMSGQVDADLPTDWPATVRRHFIAKPFSAAELTIAMRAILVAAHALD